MDLYLETNCAVWFETLQKLGIALANQGNTLVKPALVFLFCPNNDVHQQPVNEKYY